MSFDDRTRLKSERESWKAAVLSRESGAVCVNERRGGMDCWSVYPSASAARRDNPEPIACGFTPQQAWQRAAEFLKIEPVSERK